MRRGIGAKERRKEESRERKRGEAELLRGSREEGRARGSQRPRRRTESTHEEKSEEEESTTSSEGSERGEEAEAKRPASKNQDEGKQN